MRADDRRCSVSEASSLTSSTLEALNIETKFGCQHYKRFAKLIAPCCGKEYFCRICHDTSEDHKINRYAITTFVCIQCGRTQPPSQTCLYCKLCFGNYFCSICNLLDDDPTHDIFHCDKCRICRAGQQDKLTHCDVCDMCVFDINNHLCKPEMYSDICSICLEELKTSIYPSLVLPCKHVFHKKCVAEIEMYTGFLSHCPVCKQSLYNASDFDSASISSVDSNSAVINSE